MGTTLHDSVNGAEQHQPTLVEALGPYDIICGRNKLAFNNIGNRRFRVTVQLSMDRYRAATSRKETSKVIKYIADVVRENGGRFLRLSPCGTHWIELDKKHIHEKVGHALRDAAPAKRESDSATKKILPYIHPSGSSTNPHLQQDSDNTLHTTLKKPAATARRPKDSAAFSLEQLLQVSTLDQCLSASQTDGVSELDSTYLDVLIQPLECPDEDSKPPAIQLHLEQINAINPTSTTTPNAAPKIHKTNRRGRDNSILSPRRLRHQPPLDQWIEASRRDNVTTLNSEERDKDLQPHGGQDNTSKIPAIQLPQQEHQVDSDISLKGASSLSPEGSPILTETSIPDASASCSIDREHETFDHSSLGDHHDGFVDWHSEETLLE